MTLDIGVAFNQIEGQIKGGTALFAANVTYQCVWVFGLVAKGLPTYCDLEYRRAAGVSGGVEFFYQQTEGVVLVLLSSNHFFFDLGQQRGEVRIVFKGNPQHYRVDKITHNGGSFGAVSSHHRGADDQVFLIAITRQ